MSEETQLEETSKKHYPCPSCGGGMEFDPESETLKCPHCSHTENVPDEEQEVVESDYHSTLLSLEESEETEERVTVTCDNCGAEVTFDENITTDECPYCASSISAQHHSTRVLKPKYLLPFALTEQEAAENFKKWLAGRWFLPGKVKERAKMMKMDGIYSPFWTYDSNTTTRYTGMRGEHYTTTEHYTVTNSEGKSETKTRTVTKTRWYPTAGIVYNSFDDILALGSSSLPRTHTEKLEPWDLESLVPYDPSYLHGFRVESYSIDLENGFHDAKQQMMNPIKQTIRRDIGGDEQRIMSTSIDYNDITFKHILLPIWISAFRFDSKVYRFLVNARTGEVQGERPWSWVKISILVLVITIVIAAIVFFATRK